MTSQGEVHTFDFWALENKRMAVKDIPSTEEGYYMREKERKIDTGLKDDKDRMLCQIQVSILLFVEKPVQSP